MRISSGITIYLVAADCTGDIESEEGQGRVNAETSRGETTGVMTPVVNIRRPTVDWGVNLQRSVVCLRVYTCSPINAYTCIYMHTHTYTYAGVKLVTYLFQPTYRFNGARFHLN